MVVHYCALWCAVLEKMLHVHFWYLLVYWQSMSGLSWCNIHKWQSVNGPLLLYLSFWSSSLKQKTGSKTKNWAITWPLMAQFSVFTEQRVESGGCQSDSQLSALPLQCSQGCGGGGRCCLLSSWEVEQGAVLVSGWILTFLSGFLQSLDPRSLPLNLCTRMQN